MVNKYRDANPLVSSPWSLSASEWIEHLERLMAHVREQGKALVQEKASLTMRDGKVHTGLATQENSRL